MSLLDSLPSKKLLPGSLLHIVRYAANNTVNLGLGARVLNVRHCLEFFEGVFVVPFASHGHRCNWHYVDLWFF